MDWLRESFSAKGKFGRLDYLAYLVIAVIAYLVVGGALIISSMIIMGTLGDEGLVITESTALTWSIAGGFVVSSYIGICSAIKRLNDLGKPGALCIVLFIPIIGFFFWLYLVLKAGKV